jgi:hypothetical protein
MVRHAPLSKCRSILFKPSFALTSFAFVMWSLAVAGGTFSNVNVFAHIEKNSSKSRASGRPHGCCAFPLVAHLGLLVYRRGAARLRIANRTRWQGASVHAPTHSVQTIHVTYHNSPQPCCAAYLHSTAAESPYIPRCPRCCLALT